MFIPDILVVLQTSSMLIGQRTKKKKKKSTFLFLLHNKYISFATEPQSMNTHSLTGRITRLQDHLSSQYVDFDRETTTDRLLSLYSDFSKLKILNPYGYDANVNYWRAVILDCNLHGYLTTKDYSCFIDKDELADLFYRPQKGKPLSLNHVIVSIAEIVPWVLMFTSSRIGRYD